MEKFKNVNRVSRVHVPKEELFRGECDGSLKSGNSVASYAIVSYKGRLLYQNTIREDGVNSEYSELLAIRMLLQNAKRLHIKYIEVVNDCKSVVDVINHSNKLFKGKNAKRLNRHVLAIRELMSEFDYIMIKHRYREHTVYSDSLCRMYHRGIPIRKTGGKVDLGKRVVEDSK